MSQLLDPVSVSAPLLHQEAQVIPNKTDNDGHHYLKVLLLSNKMSRNKWIAPYDKIGNLPKHVLDSYMGLPYVSGHNYEFFDKLGNILNDSGLTDEQVNSSLRDECNKPEVKKGYIDHLFMDDLNASALYGQLKITDPEENKYIEEHKRPSFKFTSPAVNGVYTEDHNGYKTYNMDTLRAFHIASVPVPAFPEHEAKIKGTCSGSSDSCKRALAYAGLEPSDMSTPTENVNNSCGCNKNIQEMSSNTNNQTPAAAVTTVTTTTEPAAPGNLLADSKSTTAEAIEAARKEAQKVIDENNNKKSTIQAPQQSEKEKPEVDEEALTIKSELRKYKSDLEQERKEKQDMKNFFLEELLVTHIPRDYFKKDEEFITEKDTVKAIINKYNMNLEDAKWLIVKSVKGIPNQNQEQQQDTKKKHGVGVAGLLSSSTTYNSDIVTKSNTSVPKPAGGHFEEDDYPLGIE